MGEKSEAPALAGEVWRGEDPFGKLLAVAPWLLAPAVVWLWCGDDHERGRGWERAEEVGEEGRDGFALTAWALAERARAEKAEKIAAAERALRVAILAEEVARTDVEDLEDHRASGGLAWPERAEAALAHAEAETNRRREELAALGVEP